ncbi:MAG: calcium/proton exchanger, partial [Candidatus Saccharimonadales bacterium]
MSKINKKISGIDAFFLGMLVFVPTAIAANYLGFSALGVFALCALAIIPLAKYIGEATEELAGRTGPVIGGLLNVTFGNATELLIGIFAINAGLIEVVKASITGSIIGNLLLVTGMAMLAGGARHKKQEFNKTGASASASTLMLSAIALIIPAIFLQTAPVAGVKVIGKLSVLVSVFMLITYFAQLLFMLRTHKHLYESEAAKYEPKWSTTKSVGILI